MVNTSTLSSNKSSSAARQGELDFFKSSTPLGFAGGDANLTRYVGNSPTTSTDPTGQEEAPTIQYWDGKYDHVDPTKWHMEGMRYLVAPLPPIPRVRISTTAPTYSAYTYDNVDITLMPSIFARNDIRSNVMHHKVTLVNSIANMLGGTNPTLGGDPVTLTGTEIEEISNRLADWYIRAVDEFLLNHRGAKRKQGSRNLWLHKLGIQNEANHPWCDDWATKLLESSSDFLDEKVQVGGKEMALNCFLTIERAQWHGWIRQHNYLLVKPRGYTVADPLSNDSVIILFDPWIELAPRVYTPKNQPYTPMNTGIKIGQTKKTSTRINKTPTRSDEQPEDPFLVEIGGEIHHIGSQ